MCTISLFTKCVRSLNRPIHTFCKHTVKHNPSQRKQIESKVKLDYVLTPLLCVTSGGQTLSEYGDIQSIPKYAC